MGTKNNPGKFDCYANAEPDEPMFVLLGRDPVASAVIAFWSELRTQVARRAAIAEGRGYANALSEEEQDKLIEADATAESMRAYAIERGKETLVNYADSESERLLGY